MISINPPPGFKSKFEVVGCWCEVEDKVLFIRRHPSKPEGGLWATPAGKIDKNESPSIAMQRELLEETQLQANPNDLIYFKKVYVRYPTYDFVYHIFKYLLNELPSIVLNPVEHVDYQWLQPKEALKLSLIEDEVACIQLIYNIK